jgi:hypothetical protein
MTEERFRSRHLSVAETLDGNCLQVVELQMLFEKVVSRPQ